MSAYNQDAYVQCLHTLATPYMCSLVSVFGTSCIIFYIYFISSSTGTVIYIRTYICTYVRVYITVPVLDVSHYLVLLGFQEPHMPAILAIPERVGATCCILDTMWPEHVEWVVQLLGFPCM